MLTYNVQALPHITGRGKSKKVFVQIGKMLRERRALGTAPHIVAIQEAFNDKAHQVVVHAGYPHSISGPGPEGLRARSGLIILSEFPITRAVSKDFRDCVSWDCWVRKSIVLTEITIPEWSTPLTFINTHLNSDPDTDPFTSREKTQEIRLKQIQQIGKILAKHMRPQTPAIFAGDFNILPKNIDYLALLTTGNWLDAVFQCSDRVACSGDPHPREYWEHSVDHQLFQKSEGMEVLPFHFEETFKEKWEDKKLSDHSGLEVHYQMSAIPLMGR